MSSSSSSSFSLSNEIFRFGHTAVITGSSSGIGRAAAMMCAEKGMNVYLVDIDTAELEATVQHVKDLVATTTWSSSSAVEEEKQQTIVIEGVVLDVSDMAAMERFKDTVVAAHGTIHFLMNNAGVGIGGGAMTDVETLHKVMGVNTYGPIHGCLAFVPTMKQRGEIGLIVTTGSKQGITMPPGNLTYNISKAALKVYTEGLEYELRKDRLDNGGKLYSALLIPGWVNTSLQIKTTKHRCAVEGKEFSIDDVFFHEDKPAKGAWMPRQVIDFMVQELDKERFYLICPDNDVDRELDNLRMSWTMGDIIENRPPLSRWDKEWSQKFEEFCRSTSK
jgi:NAD(P)-dependent dehydrogenase (short-subunit alcohol dehydrogenase family)